MDFERDSDNKSHIRVAFIWTMADEAKPSAVSCVNALTAFLENGKALLELAEKESSEGRQHLVGTGE